MVSVVNSVIILPMWRVMVQISVFKVCEETCI